MFEKLNQSKHEHLHKIGKNINPLNYKETRPMPSFSISQQPIIMYLHRTLTYGGKLRNSGKGFTVPSAYAVRCKLIFK